MSERHKIALLSIYSLVVGCALYIIFRSDSYVAKLFSVLPFIVKIQEFFLFADSDFLKYYFPDYLWCLGLCCALIAIHTPKLKSVLLCSTVSVICGMAWELSQYIGIINGTGDILDIIMYLLAGVTAVIIYLKEKK